MSRNNTFVLYETQQSHENRGFVTKTPTLLFGFVVKCWAEDKKKRMCQKGLGRPDTSARWVQPHQRFYSKYTIFYENMLIFAKMSVSRPPGTARHKEIKTHYSGRQASRVVGSLRTNSGFHRKGLRLCACIVPHANDKMCDPTCRTAVLSCFRVIKGPRLDGGAGKNQSGYPFFVWIHSLYRLVPAFAILLRRRDYVKTFTQPTH